MRRGRGRPRGRQSRRPPGRRGLLDAFARRLGRPLLDLLGRALARRGVPPAAPALAGLGAGLAAALAVATARDGAALVLVPLWRLALGIAGAASRAPRGEGGTGQGTPVDLAPSIDPAPLIDGAVRAALPLAFVLRDPANAPAGAVLLLALGLRAIAAAARPGGPAVPGAGLAGDAGSALFTLAMIAWPPAFPLLALALAGLTFMAALARLAAARALARDDGSEEPS